MVVEFGDPVMIEPDLLNTFDGPGKRVAVEQLVQLTLESLQCLTLNSGNWETLEMLQATRRLYVPENSKLGLGQALSLTRKLAIVSCRLALIALGI